MRGNGEILSQVISSQVMNTPLLYYRQVDSLACILCLQDSTNHLNTQFCLRKPFTFKNFYLLYYSLSFTCFDLGIGDIKAELLAQYGGVAPKQAEEAHSRVIDKVI